LGGKDPTRFAVVERLLPSSFQYPLGSDTSGREIFGMMLVGIKNTLLIGFTSGLIGILIAVSIALLAAYKGGIIDQALTSLMDTFLVLPTWAILVVISAYFRNLGLSELCLLLAIFTWPAGARTIRAQVLSLKERTYIDLARITMMGDLEIIFMEIMPNLGPYIIMSFSNIVIAAIFAETGLRLIGIGPPFLITLGYLLNFLIGEGFFTSRPFVVGVIATVIILIFILLTVINIGLEEEFNPRLKKITGM
jgi:peptide/nickel transport system permease protein